MLIEDLKMCESLRRIVNGFTGDPALQQDMLQECMVCLWKIEVEKPGRTRSWYLQNCRFHVQHWLAAGRSLDSHKRAHGGNRVPLQGTEEDAVLNEYHTDGELFETVSVRDLVSTLTPLLPPAEQTVLRGLAEGLLLREIAVKSGISYPTALKYRRRIAALASRLGICLPRGSWQENGHQVCLNVLKASGVKAQMVVERRPPRNGSTVAPGRSRHFEQGADLKKQQLAELKQAKPALKAGSGKIKLRRLAG